MKIKIYVLCSTILLLLTSCNEQKASTNPQQPNKTVTHLSPPSNGVNIPATKLSPNPDSTEYSIQFPLPDLLLGLSASDIPLNVCRDWPSAGEVWISQFPYESYSKILGDENSDYYFPIWSPSGEWIAYVSVIPNKLGNTFANPSLREYLESDSIRIIRPNGSDMQLVAGPFSRREAVAENGSCDFAGGIVVFGGWSSDSQWLVYIYNDLLSDSTLNSVNINTGEILTLAENGVRPKWSNTGAKILFYTASSEWVGGLRQETYELIVIDLENFPDNILSFLVPDEVPSKHRIRSVQWAEEDDALIVIIQEVYSNDNLYSLWRIDLISGKWDKITDLGNQIPIESLVGFDHMVLCVFSPFDGTSRLEVWDLIAGKLVTMYEHIPQDECGSFEKLYDFEGVELVSILRYGNSLEFSGFISIGIDFHQINILVGQSDSNPSDLDIYHYSWKP